MLSRRPKRTETLFTRHKFVFKRDQRHRQLIKALRETDCKLQLELGDGYYGIILYGSQFAGYAGKKSDCDVRLVLENYDLARNAARITRETFLKHSFGTDIAPLYPKKFAIDLECQPNAAHIEAAKFFNLATDPRVNAARMIVLDAIGGVLEEGAQDFWERCRKQHLGTIIPYDGNERLARLKKAISRTHAEPGATLRERVQKFSLPDWSAK